MNAINYTAARVNLAKTMENVCNTHTPVIITRKQKIAVVMLSLENYEIFKDKSHLLQTPINAENLQESLEEIEAGRIIEQEMIESFF